MSDPREVLLPEDLNGARADKALAVVAGVSRNVARQLIEEGGVLLNGHPPQPRTKVAVGDLLAFVEPAPAEEVSANRQVVFEVLYEDDDVAVVSKPPGLVTHPGVGHRNDTLVSGVLARWPSTEGVGQPGRWGVVHRLDRDTSGAMLVALTAEGYEGLVAQLAARAVKRSYLTLVHGVFEMKRGTIDAPIGRDASAPMRMAVEREGRPARTHYRVTETFAERAMSLLEVELETGRTHQIRVHLASIGHPVVGDGMYRRFPAVIEMPRMFLHATRLEFRHPVSGERIEVVAPLPDDLAGILDRLRTPSG